MSMLLIDTGPIVAFLDARDAYHVWAKHQLEHLQTPFLSCESVITEACFLVRRLENGQRKVLELLQRDIIKIGFHLANEAEIVAELVARYANVPMSLADACLVRMTELRPQAQVWTLDSDFRIYRKNRRQVIPLIIPE